MDILELAKLLSEKASHDKPLPAESIGADIAEYVGKELPFGAVIRKLDNGFYLDMPLDGTDIALLRSLLMSMKFCEWREQSQICSAMNSFLPGYMRCEPESLMSCYEVYNGTFYENMRTIIKALWPDTSTPNYGIDYKKLTFTYCTYDGNGKLSADGEEKTVSPISVAYTDGAFVLITFSNNDTEFRTEYETFRIDRMRNVSISEKNTSEDYTRYSNTGIKYYRDSDQKRRSEDHDAGRMFEERKADSAEQSVIRHINERGFDLAWFMGTGGLTHDDDDAVTAEISVNADSTDIIADNFYGCSEELGRDGDSVRVRVKVSGRRRDKLVQLALRYPDKVQVLSPEPVRDEIADSAKKLLAVYGKGGSK